MSIYLKSSYLCLVAILSLVTNTIKAEDVTFQMIHENLENGFRGFVLPETWRSDSSFYQTSNQDTVLLVARYFVFTRRFNDFNLLMKQFQHQNDDFQLLRKLQIEKVNAENEQAQHAIADSLIFELKKSTVTASEEYEIWLDILFTAVLNRTKMYQEAIDLYQETEARIDSLDLRHIFTYTHINIANSYYRLGEVEFANQLYHKSRLQSKTYGNTRMLGIALNNLAVNFSSKKLGNSLQLDSAKLYNEAAKRCFESICDTAKFAGSIMISGLILMSTSPYDPANDEKAQKLLIEANTLFNRFPNFKKQASLLSNLASINWYSGNYEEATVQFHTALTIAKMKGLHSLDYQIAELFSHYYKERQNSDSALHYAERAAASKVNFSKSDQKKSLMAFYALYDTESFKNESLAKSLEIAKNELKIQSQQTKQNYLLGSGLFALLIGGYALRSQRKKRKASELALAQREETAEKEVEELMQQHRFATLAASIDAEEKERDRLSKELHDGVGSTISGIAMQLEAIRNDQQVEALSPLLVRLRSSYDELRALSRNIGMPAVKENTLVELTGTLLANVQADSSLQINYVVFPKEEAFNIDQRIEISVYRIIQEAMNNIMKHAQANQVEVQLTKSEAELDVMIEDDGKGFDANVLAKGIGLKNMRDRVETMGGEFHIDTRLNKGTILSFSIPLKS